MKRLTAFLLTGILLLGVCNGAVLTAAAHGHHHRTATVVSTCTFPGCTLTGSHEHETCSIAECTETGCHEHDGILCYPQCTDPDCTLTEAHIHAYCGRTDCTLTSPHRHGGCHGYHSGCH